MHIALIYRATVCVCVCVCVWSGCLTSITFGCRFRDNVLQLCSCKCKQRCIRIEIRTCLLGGEMVCQKLTGLKMYAWAKELLGETMLTSVQRVTRESCEEQSCFWQIARNLHFAPVPFDFADSKSGLGIESMQLTMMWVLFYLFFHAVSWL